MDDLDRQILSLLRQDSRLAISRLATMIGTSRATARTRVERLYDEGVISRFTIELGLKARNASVRAIVQVEVRGKHADQVTEQLLAMDDILAVHSTNGRWDLVTELECRDLRSFDETLRQIRLLDGVTQTESSLLLSSHTNSLDS